MAQLVWDDPSSRQFEVGIDRGVLYLTNYKTTHSSSPASNSVGLKTFDVASSSDFEVGMRVKIDRDAGVVDRNYLMYGVVTALTSTSLTVDVTSIAGDTYLPVAGWDISALYNVFPWNGISSVDENGSEGSVSYYMDGRPFLYFPKPREFSASVKAYTYPEEFNDVMGVVEATDGMYLDSQVGDTFAFSYRTRIGNPTDGVDFGYKIHIVYNATVVMSGVSYNTIGTSVDPIQFDFPIQAVPMPVDGYRATAHIMIDTRNIEPPKLQEIEAMLYGTESAPAYLPSPQEVFDILKYGDTIIITDLGSGLWEAEGASVNVHETGNGDTFEILNVNATDNGDGSYYVSSTP